MQGSIVLGVSEFWGDGRLGAGRLGLMTEIEVGFMKRMNSCLICILLMKMMTHQIVFGLIK